MLSAPPERQAKFEALRAAHGSRFAWHGSRPENWHAILRSGLRNASGTKLQLNGAAHGKGIYLSTSVAYSENYSQMPRQQSSSQMPTHRGLPRGGAAAGRGAPRHHPPPQTKPPAPNNAFLVGRDLRIIALCEVADAPSIKKTGNIWVCPDEDAVITRLLFAFPTGVDKGGRDRGYGEDTLLPAFEDEVRACIAGIRSTADDAAGTRKRKDPP